MSGTTEPRLRVAVRKNWLSRRTPLQFKKRTGLVEIVDLFCGCGGLTLGAIEAISRKRRAWKVAAAIDTNADAIGVFQSNFRQYSGVIDIGNVAKPNADIQDAFKKYRNSRNKKLLLAGPPCQGHSDLNNHSRRDDPRNLLYLEVSSIAVRLLPDLTVIENVPGVRHDHHRTLDKTTRKLAAHGYMVTSFVLDATMIGWPQRRRRHFLIASMIGQFDESQIVRGLYNRPLCLHDIIGDLQDEPPRQESRDIYKAPGRLKF